MLGAKVRQLRRREKLTQAQMAERLEVSASYLNLIENNRRPLTANLLLKLAQTFQLDLSSFAPSDDARLVAELREVFSDPLFEGDRVTTGDLKELAAGQPGVARTVLRLYRGYRNAMTSAESLAEKLSAHGGGSSVMATSPIDEINDQLQRRNNHFPQLEEAAERLWEDAMLSLDDVYGGLVEHLQKEHGITVRVEKAAPDQPMRRFDPRRGLITLSEVLPPRSRRFQLAHQVALITQSDAFDEIDLADDLGGDESHALARVVLANYFAAAILMPYSAFRDAAEDVRYDIELLAHRYRCSFEQVCHRLTTLSRKGKEGIPLHFMRIDVAGNISKRFSGSGIRMPRFSGACPRWNIHAAFLTPGLLRIQLSRMPDGTVYFCIARTVQRAHGGWNAPHTVYSVGLGCEVRFARRMVYSDGIDLDHLDAATPVGTTCRTCERMSCEQRVFPPVQHPLQIDENERGMSFFAPVSSQRKRHGDAT